MHLPTFAQESEAALQNLVQVLFFFFLQGFSRPSFSSFSHMTPTLYAPVDTHCFSTKYIFNYLFLPGTVSSPGAWPPRTHCSVSCATKYGGLYIEDGQQGFLLFEGNFPLCNVLHWQAQALPDEFSGRRAGGYDVM